MINKDFNSITELLETFPDEQSCIEHLEDLRWGGYVISPFDVKSKIYKCKYNQYRCTNTNKYFNVKTNTIYDNTKISLQKWFMAILLITSIKESVSSIQLAKELDVTQRTSLFLIKRIRNCFNIQEVNNNG